VAYDYKTGTIINPSAPLGSLEQKQPYIDNGVAIVSKDCYMSTEFMQQETEALWPNTWLLAGVKSDIAKLGEFFTFDIGNESIIVSHTEQGVKAFYNVCSHRGNRLERCDRGRKKTFICPFHSWTFKNTGELISITDKDTFRPEVIAHNPGLVEVACAELAGIIFINMNDSPDPLVKSIGLPSGYLEAYNIDKMKVVRHVQVEWDANWKVGVEAFYESYHLHSVHPETRPVMGDLNVQYDLYPNGASRMIVPLGQPSPRLDDQTTVNAGLKYMLEDAGVDSDSFKGTAAEVRKAIQQSKRKRAEVLGLDYSKLEDGQLSDSWATGIFPNVQIGCHPEGVFIMRFLPHETDPERFYYDTMTLIAPILDDKSKAPAWMGIPEGTDLTGAIRPPSEKYKLGEDANLGVVLSQDADLLTQVQKGMRSKGFRGQLWGEQEQRLRHFHTELVRRMDQAT